jgi:hypothetical protein
VAKEANNKQVSDFGKHGGLVMDEMSIQDDLVIQNMGDSWNLVGMVDMDTTNNNIDIICNGTHGHSCVTICVSWTHRF